VTDLSTSCKRVVASALLVSSLVLTGSALPEPIKYKNIKLETQIALARSQNAAGRFEASLAGFQRALAIAESDGDVEWAIKIQSNIGSQYCSLYRYQEAVQAYLAARQTAKSHGRVTLAVALDVNLAALYILIGDLEAANQTAEEALKLARTYRIQAFRYQLTACLAELRAKEGRKKEAIAFFQEALVFADRTGSVSDVARIWEHLGELMLREADYQAAEGPLLEAFRLRTLFHDRDIRVSFLNVAWLRLEQGDLRSASALLARAEVMPQLDSGAPTWFVSFLRGRLAQKSGQLKASSRFYSEAFLEALQWQEEIGPSDNLRGVSFSREEFQRVYESLVESSLALDAEQAVHAFEATELYRAAALRQTLMSNRHWIKEMPAEYWTLSRRLRAAEIAELTHHDDSNPALISSLRGKLAEVQIEHSPKDIKTGEKYRPGSALKAIQGSLREDEALFSFYIGSTSTVLWAITKQRIQRYPLPDAVELAALAKQFRADVQSRRRSPAASSLYKALFQNLDPDLTARRTWIVSASDSLFSIPFVALEVGSKEGKPVYLLEQHAVLHIPSALMLNASARVAPKSGFIGVGDGIYNSADTRWRAVKASLDGFGVAAKPSLQLPRLAGSGQEIDGCAAKWGEQPLLLKGRDASGNSLETALHSHPAVLHLAAHVISPSPDRPDESAIDLGLDDKGRPDVLTSDDISGLDASGAIVVMSGCSSASGAAVSGKGVLGLTRAWLLAGARVVVGSRWPTPDDTGELFQSFYQHFRNLKDETDRTRAAARALRAAQLDMLRSGTWRSSTWYWSAFYALGKE
jgi:CHAT domain-containing protein/tetratricopeptide (TPR) repeat protein